MGVNQITFDPTEAGGKGAFVLWYYGQREEKFNPADLSRDAVRRLNSREK